MLEISLHEVEEAQPLIEFLPGGRGPWGKIEHLGSGLLSDDPGKLL
jgi:hypothetical protein